MLPTDSVCRIAKRLLRAGKRWYHPRVRSGDSPIRDQSRREPTRSNLDATDFPIHSSSSTRSGTICSAVSIVTSEKTISRGTPLGGPPGGRCARGHPRSRSTRIALVHYRESGGIRPAKPRTTSSPQKDSRHQEQACWIDNLQISSRSGWLRVSSSRPRRDSLLPRVSKTRPSAAQAHFSLSQDIKSLKFNGFPHVDVC
jgi:hypothetical protein